MSTTELSLTFAQPVLQCLILFTMIKRNLRSQFPIFFNYTIFSVLGGIIIAVVFQRGSESQYFYTYWSLTGGGILLAFAALYEVFCNMLKPYSALKDLGRLLFAWVALFLVLSAAVTALATSGSGIDKICTTVMMLQRVLRLMEVGLLLLLVAFESRLGLSWRSHGVSIALGLGCMAAMDLMVSYGLQRLPGSALTLSIVHQLALDCVVTVWAVNFILPQPKRNAVSDAPTGLIFQRWNEVLMATPLVSKSEATAMSSVESFLPGVERTVERVMARKMMH